MTLSSGWHIKEEKYSGKETKHDKSYVVTFFIIPYKLILNPLRREENDVLIRRSVCEKFRQIKCPYELPTLNLFIE